MKNIFNLSILFFCFQVNFAQNFDKKLVSKKTELNLSFEPKMRGIEIGNVVYFLENDLQTLKAFENGKLKWKTNVIELCGKPKIGKSEIRAIKLKENKLLVVFGKHSFVEVDRKTGKTKFFGSD